LGHTYYVFGKFDLALDHLNKALELDAKCENAYLGRARLYRAQSKFTEVILDYLKAIELNPTNKEVVTELKNLLANQDEIKIYQFIFSQPTAIQIHLIKQCIDPKTPWGQRFYGTEEDFTGANLDCLDILYQRLNQLESDLSLPVSVTEVSIFKPRKNTVYVEAKKEDKKYFQSDAPESDTYTLRTAIGLHNKL
jgi:tetratricopeptide (TPR) repeat protein